MSAQDAAKMSIQGIMEAYAARFEGWAVEQDRLSATGSARQRRESRIKAQAYRDVTAELRKFGGLL